MKIIMDASYCTAETLHTLLRLMASRGLKTQQLPRLDLPADALFNRRSRIPLLTMLNLLHWAEQQIGNDTLSLDFGMLLAVNDTDSSFGLSDDNFNNSFNDFSSYNFNFFTSSKGLIYNLTSAYIFKF